MLGNRLISMKLWKLCFLTLLFSFFTLVFPPFLAAENFQGLIERVDVIPAHQLRFEAGLISEVDRKIHDNNSRDQISTTGFSPLRVRTNPGIGALPLEAGLIFAHYREKYDGDYEDRTHSLGPFLYLKSRASPYHSVLMGIGGGDRNSNELLTRSNPDLKLNIPFRFPLEKNRFLYGEAGFESHSGSPKDYGSDYASTLNYGLGVAQYFKGNRGQYFLEIKGQTAPLENSHSYHDRLKLTAGAKLPLEMLFFTEREGEIFPFVSHGLQRGSPGVAFGINFSLLIEETRNRGPRDER